VLLFARAARKKPSSFSLFMLGKLLIWKKPKMEALYIPNSIVKVAVV